MSKIKLNKSDIFKMVNECIRQLIKENQFDELVGYHGTVHDFDRFDLSHIGSGEGTQVYGYGVYITDVKDTGRFYAALVALPKIKTEDCPLKILYNRLNYVRGIIHEMNPLNFEKKKLAAIKSLTNKMEKEKNIETKEKTLQAIKFIEHSTSCEQLRRGIDDMLYDITVNINRIVYRVDIPDNGYIDWTNSDPKFLKYIYDVFSQRYDTSHVDFNKVKNFGDLHEELRGWKNKTEFKQGEKIPQKEISKVLEELGYVGIKVPTGYKKGGDGRGSNYVIFDENNVKIIGKQNLQGQKDF